MDFEYKKCKCELMMNPFVTRKDIGKAKTDVYITVSTTDDGMDIFSRGLYPLSDNKMTKELQDKIIEVV